MHDLDRAHGQTIVQLKDNIHISERLCQRFWEFLGEYKNTKNGALIVSTDNVN